MSRLIVRAYDPSSDEVWAGGFELQPQARDRGHRCW